MPAAEDLEHRLERDLLAVGDAVVLHALDGEVLLLLWAGEREVSGGGGSSVAGARTCVIHQIFFLSVGSPGKKMKPTMAQGTVMTPSMMKSQRQPSMPCEGGEGPGVSRRHERAPAVSSAGKVTHETALERLVRRGLQVAREHLARAQGGQGSKGQSAARGPERRRLAKADAPDRASCPS